MAKQWQWMLYVIVTLSFAGMACGLFTDGPEPAAEAVDAPAEEGAGPSPSEGDAAAGPAASDAGADVQEMDEPDQPAPDTAVGGAIDDSVVSEALGRFDPAALGTQAEFDSYRFSLLMEFGGADASGNALLQSIEADMAVVTEPPAMELAMRIEGVEDAEEFGDLEISVLDDTTYMVVPGFGCVTSSAGDSSPFAENPFADLLNPSTLFDELQTTEFVGEEVVNDVPTLVFSFDETFLDAADEVEWADGRIYVAREGNFLVRLVLEGEGNLGIIENSADDSGTLYVEFNIFDINEPLEVQLPEACEENVAATASLPMLEDAYETSSFSGFLSYKSNATIKDALEFYELALTVDDWVKNEAESLNVPGTAIVRYDRQSESINLTVSSDEETGGIMVLIVTEGGG